MHWQLVWKCQNTRAAARELVSTGRSRRLGAKKEEENGHAKSKEPPTIVSRIITITVIINIQMIRMLVILVA